MASGHRHLPSQSLCGRVPLSDGDHSVCAPVSTPGGLDGLHRSQGSVSSSASSSCFSSLSTLRVPGHGLPVQSSVFWPLRGSAGLHQGHGSCFSYTPFSGYPYASIPRRLASPVFLSGVSPGGSPDCPPTLSRIGNSHQSQEVQPRTFPGSAVSRGRHRLHLFQGFSVGGTHLTAAVNSRRISVLRLAYCELVAVASRRAFFAGSPRSWRQTEDAVPPALPPSFMEPSGSGGSSVGVDGVSSQSPVVAPSPSSISRRVSALSVSRPTLLVKRLGLGLGRPYRLSGRFGPVGPPSGSVVYQRQGTAGCSAGAFPVPVSSPRSHGGCLLRQHHGGSLPSQGGWHQVSSPQQLGSGESLSIRLAPQFFPGSNNVLADALSRPHQLPHTEWSLNMTVFLSLRRLWPVQIDLFATSANHRCSIYFSPFWDPRSAGTDAFLQSWDGLQAYAFPPVAVIPRVLAKLRASTGTELTLVAPHWAQRPWFSDLVQLSLAPPVILPSPSRPLALASVSSSLPGSPSAQASCLATLQRFTRAAGFSSAVAEQSSLARRPSWRAVYQVRWSIYRGWCHSNGHSVSRPTLAKVADFLYWLRYTRGLSVSSLRGYRSVLSAVFRFHLPSLSSDPVIRDLLRSFRLSSAERVLRPPAWDLSKVLTYLVSPAFEPLSQASFRALTMKTLFLLALATAKRVEELQALSSIVTFVAGDASLSYIPQFVAKSESLTRSIPRSFLVKSLADFAAGLDTDLLLCPVRALRLYLLWARSLSPGRHRLFVSPRRPTRPLSKNAVSFFLREVISAAGAARPQVGSLRAHEVRSVSTSVTFYRNWSVTSVLESATWASSSVFSSFYLRDIQHEFDGLLSLGPFVAAVSRIG